METEEVGGVGGVGEEVESEWEEEWITEESSKEPDRESTVPMYNYFRKESVPSSIPSPIPSSIPSSVASVPIYEARIGHQCIINQRIPLRKLIIGLKVI